MRALRVYGGLGPMQRRFAALVIGSQALVVLFGALAAFGLASSRDEGWRLLGLGALLAAACVLCAGLLRRRWGVTLGWALQAATLAWGAVVPAMLVIGVIFLALWITALVQGGRLDAR